MTQPPKPGWKPADTEYRRKSPQSIRQEPGKNCRTEQTVTDALDVNQQPAGDRRFDPMSDAWPMVVIDVLVVVGLASLGKLLGDMTGSGAAGWYVFAGATTVLQFVFVALPLRVSLRAQRKTAHETQTELRVQNERQQFDARLNRALEMTDSENVALSIAARALALCGDDLHGSILLADNSDAHLQTVITTSGCPSSARCDVATPRSCPAVRIGHTLSFDTSNELDSCPNLIERGLASMAALCVPVSVVGRATGVVHVVRDGLAFNDEERTKIETVAHSSGQRVGMLRATAQTQLQASTDSLTGLFNRRTMENSVRQLAENHVPYAISICDLDHFKVLNDTYGHDTGDRALRLFALTLRNSVRAGDLVSRHGGEEFVVVMPHADIEAAAAIMDRLRLELLAAVSDGRTPSFTVSAGIADTVESSDYQTLLAIADERLLAAKRGGRDRVLTSTKS